MTDDATKSAKRTSSRKASPPPTTDAQRRAAVILEVLAGVRTAQEAAEVLKISCNHYYILERKGLAGLVAACEPAPRRGPAPDAELQVKTRDKELACCRQDCQRQAALVRATQRAVGVPLTPAAEETSAKRKRNGKGGTRRRRRQPRAARAAQSLQKTIAEQDAAAVQQTVKQASESKLQEVTKNKEDCDGSPRT